MSITKKLVLISLSLPQICVVMIKSNSTARPCAKMELNKVSCESIIWMRYIKASWTIAKVPALTHFIERRKKRRKNIKVAHPNNAWAERTFIDWNSLLKIIVVESFNFPIFIFQFFKSPRKVSETITSHYGDSEGSSAATNWREN